MGEILSKKIRQYHFYLTLSPHECIEKIVLPHEPGDHAFEPSAVLGSVESIRKDTRAFVFPQSHQSRRVLGKDEEYGYNRMEIKSDVATLVTFMNRTNII